MSESPSMNSLDEISHEESIGEVGYWSEKYNHKRIVTSEQRYQMLQQLSKLITLEKMLLVHSFLSIILCIAVKLGQFNKAGVSNESQNYSGQDSNFTGYISQGEQPQHHSLLQASLSSESSWPFPYFLNLFSQQSFNWIKIDYYLVCILQNLLSVYLLSYSILSVDSQIHRFLTLKLNKSPQEFSFIEQKFPQAISAESEVFEQAALKEQVFSHSPDQSISFIHVMSGLTHTKSFSAKRILVLSGAALIGYNISSLSGNVEIWVLIFLAFPALAVVLPQIFLLLTFTFGILSATFIFTGFIVKETIRWIEAEINAFIRKKKIQKQNKKIYDNHEKEANCSICLSELHENDKSNNGGVGVLPECSHTFHLKCIQLWIKEADHCPICRTQI